MENLNFIIISPIDWILKNIYTCVDFSKDITHSPCLLPDLESLSWLLQPKGYHSQIFSHGQNDIYDFALINLDLLVLSRFVVFSRMCILSPHLDCTFLKDKEASHFQSSFDTLTKILSKWGKVNSSICIAFCVCHRSASILHSFAPSFQFVVALSTAIEHLFNT